MFVIKEKKNLKSEETVDRVSYVSYLGRETTTIGIKHFQLLLIR